MGCYKNNFMGNSKQFTHHAHHVIHTRSGDESKKIHVFNNMSKCTHYRRQLTTIFRQVD